MKTTKYFKKLLALTAAAIMLAFLPNANTLMVSAEEPTTYYLRLEEGQSDWRFQEGSVWNEEDQGRELYYLRESIKDGDYVIVGVCHDNKPIELDVRLGNLTIMGTGTFVMASVSGGIDNCFFLDGSKASVTGNVFNGYVYNTAIANFNNNVTNLYSYNNVVGTGPTIGVAGTVGYYMSEDTQQVNAPYGINFAAGSFSLDEGGLKTESWLYTRDATGPITSNPASATTSTGSTATATASQPAAGASADEYDRVPKTGETSPVVWLSLIAVFCSGAGLLLRKSGDK